MTINLNAPLMTELKPRIVVIGVGGAGGNAVNNMISSGLEGVEFIVANTDSQALTQSQADRRIQLGAGITQGLGCGAQPDVGRAAAEEAIDQILDHMAGTHMAFITAGMGGGTGTGGAPVIAEALRNQGILTIGVVTKPFQFEGGQRLLAAERGIEELQSFVDTLIIIPNQNLFRIANEKTTFADAFAMADDVLHSGVRGITDLMVSPGLINLDFADVKTVMAEMGKAMMGTGEAEGETRAVNAAEAAISNPLLDDVSMQGARGVLINITGGMDLTLYEVDEAANRVRQEVDPDANIIIGSALEDTLNGRMRVSVVATGIEVENSEQRPVIAAPRLAAVAGRPILSASTTSSSEVEKALDTELNGDSLAEKVVIKPSDASNPVTPIETEQPQALSLSLEQHVPAPKPPEAEPEPLEKKAVSDVSVEDKPFIAPNANRPEKDHAPLHRPDAMAEAEAINPTDSPAKRKRSGFSLFRRKAEPQTPTVEAATRPQAGLDTPEPSGADQAVTNSVTAEQKIETQSTTLSAEPTLQTSPVISTPNPSQPLAPLQVEEDLLEIPSFLRRQAN